MKALALCVLAACGSSAPAPAEPTPAPVPVDATPVDAAPTPPAEPVASAELQSSPAWQFHYATAERTEQWSLHVSGSEAMVVVENAQGPRTYLGSAKEDDKSIAIEVTNKTGKIALDCKKTTRKLSAKCNYAKAKPVTVLDCYVPDFKEPMPFALAPGVEYVVDKGCTGYRLKASTATAWMATGWNHGGESWTVQFADGHSLVTVQSVEGTHHYSGTATGGDVVTIDASEAGKRVAFQCTKTTHALGPACNDAHATPVDVLACSMLHDQEPVLFAAAPGTEFVAGPECGGYRLAK